MSYIWAAGIVLLVGLLLAILFIRFVLHKEGYINAALESGQRLEISLKTGEVKGKVSNSAKAGGKEAVDKGGAEVKGESDTRTDQLNQAGEDQAKSPEKDTEADKQPSWIKEDFVGPRLPEGVIEALLGNETKSKLSVSSVSIKDISAKPVVVIIIKGMGLSSSSTREALELPKEITMGFSPYSPSLDEWVKKSKASGHEVILNIPMETKDYHVDNPGPYSLLTQASEEDNTTRLKMLLGLIKGYSAIYSENSEVFTRSANSVRPVLELLKKENKYFLYGGGYANYSMVQVADSINYPILVNDLVLDDDISSSAINERFRELEKIAKEKGYVVVMAHPYPITVRMLKAWLPKTEEKGLVVSPVSTLLGKVFK